jgi:hypothetical protein
MTNPQPSAIGLRVAAGIVYPLVPPDDLFSPEIPGAAIRDAAVFSDLAEVEAARDAGVSVEKWQKLGDDMTFNQTPKIQ